ncbi:DUF4349 domain-containing protein [Sediminibacter sp. Hel_I_10]|uniref:DUF4349 domain-containing protein n=1 Tax=Sediminibacter sp. Hel_I_10 TaxID=1392490 RepID=UPI00047D1CFF|nr:DUF4349 domain-containing protein [Sediminibacter sp. Hel_I_10]
MNGTLEKSRFKILVFVFIAFGFLSCSGDKKYNTELPLASSEDSEAISNDDHHALQLSKGSMPTPKDLKIIKSAQARYKVGSVKSSTYQIKQIAQKYDAYISDLRFENNLYKKENRFTIKIPQQNFDMMMDSIGQIVEFVEYENITTQDVTEEYIDVNTRLQTKIEIKSRYESILRKNAKTVEDILATEDKLRIIQEEIEVAQGRLNYLSNKVSYSTIQIDLYETVAYKEEPETYEKTFWIKTQEALSSGWWMIAHFLLALIYIWPITILIVVFLVVLRKRWKKRKNI